MKLDATVAALAVATAAVISRDAPGLGTSRLPQRPSVETAAGKARSRPSPTGGLVREGGLRAFVAPTSVGGTGHVGLVPWRDPAGDLAALFPGATGYRAETRILSHLRLSLAQHLGHPPMGDDLLLRSYRVLRESRPVGSILVRRVKGEYGAIELVLAVTPAGRVRGVRLQRQREPAPIAAALQRPSWRAAFAGKTADSHWRVGEDLPAVPPEARASAQAIADGARTALILFRAAESGGR